MRCVHRGMTVRRMHGFELSKAFTKLKKKKIFFLSFFFWLKGLLSILEPFIFLSHQPSMFSPDVDRYLNSIRKSWLTSWRPNPGVYVPRWEQPLRDRTFAPEIGGKTAKRARKFWLDCEWCHIFYQYYDGLGYDFLIRMLNYILFFYLTVPSRATNTSKSHERASPR